MTVAEIKSMPAGRDMDAAVGRATGKPMPLAKHFGILVGGALESTPTHEWPNYSTDIADAWPLMDGLKGAIKWHEDYGGQWHAIAFHDVYGRREWEESAFGLTAPLAICRLFLLIRCHHGAAPNV